MTGAHAVTSTTNYSYAKGLYDFPTREFRGFGEVTETRADGSKVIHYYYQDDAKKGKEYKTVTRDSADAPYAKTENFWSGDFCDTPSEGVYTCNLSRTDEVAYDGISTSPKIKRKNFENYDLYGNVQLEIERGDTSVSGDEVFNYKEFVYNPSLWIVDKVKHTYVTATDGGPKLRESWFYYDGAISIDTPPVKGNLTKEEKWLSTASNPTTLYAYDSYGNRTSITDPNGHVTTITYDSTYHTFPKQITNAKSQTTTRVYNAVNGQILQETDPNGYTTSYEYDSFHRKIKEIKPYDTSDLPTILINYSLDGTPPERALIQKRLTTGGTSTLDTRQFVDGFGNLIQTNSEAENSAQKIIVDVFYDNMGRVKKQSNPYFVNSTGGYSTPDTSVPSISYSYDTLGRPILITNPDGTKISRVFDHWQVTETDENGHTKTYTFDAFQRLKKVVENNGGSAYITNYTYNPLGELITIKDHFGNNTSIAYDSLGRKTQMTDPDMGTYQYSYDNVGNLISQTDARVVTIGITYDELNRKTYINYPASSDIQFTYDNPIIGTLSQVVDAAGEVNYFYDQRLRKVQEDRIIDGNTFSTQWTYDSMDRVRSQTYPNGEIVTYTYNPMGKLESIPGILSQLDYDASGRVITKTFSSGKSTAFTYDSRQRLKTLTTLGIQNFAYSYDNVGNITSIADGISGKTDKTIPTMTSTGLKQPLTAATAYSISTMP